MDKIAKYIYENRFKNKLITLVNKPLSRSSIRFSYINKCREIAMNRYCNCKCEKIFIPDEAYGDWIICSDCKILCGWREDNDYFDIRGKNILDTITLWDYIQIKYY